MIYLPIDIGYLTEEMKEKAEKELGETDEVRSKALAEFRKLIKEDTKLTCRVDDIYLLQYLRARKFNVKRTWNLFTNYFHVKKSYTEVYGVSDFEGMREAIARKFISILPYRDPEGCAIFVIKLEKWDINQRKFASLVHDLTIAVMYCAEDPATQVCGIKIIADVNTLSLNHIQYTHPKYIHLIAKGMKNCLPARFKGLHIVNESVFFQYFWNIFRFVLTEKLKKRVFFHCRNKDSLLRHFPIELVPVEYGGTLVIDNQSLLERFDTMRDVYNEKISFGYKSRKLSRETNQTT